jgi:lipopolysaccharide export system permease protein
MELFNKYILKNLGINIFSIFVPLFVIASVVFLIRVSSITSIIEISTFEMFKLYLFILPDLFFYTIPLSFFIGAVSTFHKLSSDSEMVVFFALGISPAKFLRILIPIGLILSFLLIFITIVMVPHTKQMYKDFTKWKQQEAVFNIRATEFGQEFGDWSVFIESIKEEKNKKSYNNISLFYKNEVEERFIVAESANISNQEGVIRLSLNYGSLFSYKQEKISQIYFREMLISDINAITSQPYLNTFEYFKNALEDKKRREKMISSIILSFFPIAIILLIPVIGIQNSRHGKGITNLFVGLALILYYIIAFIIAKELDFYSLVFPFLWILVTIYIYNVKVLRVY